MKTVFLVLIVAAFGAAGFWYITENKRADRAARMKFEQRQREKEEQEERERIEQQRAEDERIRKERSDAMAKEDAVRLFLNYINREEDRLKDEIAELELKLEKVAIDQKSLSDELLAIEEANAVRVAHAKKRGEQQRDKVKQVSAFLKSETINRLASTYCGEDFAALRLKFESEMQTIKDVEDKYQARVKAIQKEYDESVAGIDDKVDSKLKSTSQKYEVAKMGIDKSKSDVDKLQKEKLNIEKELAKLENNKMPSPWVRRRIEDLRKQLLLVIGQLTQSQNISALSAANLEHFEVTKIADDARRKHDRAGVRKAAQDVLALKDRVHERDVYAVACRFEDLSLTQLREAISKWSHGYGTSLMAAKKKLAYLKKSAVNMDFLSKSEIEDLRRKISKSISDGIVVEDVR